VFIGVLGLSIGSTLKTESAEAAQIKQFTSYQENDRAEAGRWVAENTPSDFRVFTMWGNPAYYSKRYVYDGSYLNRRFERADLVDKYKPEVVVLQADPGVQPTDPVFPAVAGMDYFFAVLVRSDVLSRVSGIETSVNLERYILNKRIGDQFGTMKQQGREYFVHPGATSPTQFDFDAESYLLDTRRSSLEIRARIAPNVPEEAVKRGGANVSVTLYVDGSAVREQVVRVGQPAPDSRPLTASAFGSLLPTMAAPIPIGCFCPFGSVHGCATLSRPRR
jgi:hypothetical protein